MRDLAIPALAGTIALLAIYAAGLVFVAQHIAERYAPALYPIVVRDVGGGWLLILAIDTVATFVLALIKSSLWTNISETILLAAALFIAVFGQYRTFKAAADRERIINLAKEISKDRISALRDLVWSSVTRGDVTAAELAIAIPPYGSLEQSSLLDWLTQYPQLLQQSWLTNAVLRALTNGDLDLNAAERLRTAFRQLLVYCLDANLFSMASIVVVETIRAIALAPSFSNYHRYIAFDIGFNSHRVGEEGLKATARLGQPRESLEEVQEYFLSLLTALRVAIIEKDDPDSVTQFAELLRRLSESAIGPMYVSAQVYDLLEDAYPKGLLQKDCLEALASTLGYCRYLWDGHRTEEEIEGRIDELAAHLALYIVRLGYSDQLKRMMGNAGFNPGNVMPQRLLMSNSFSEDIYTVVAEDFGIHNWLKREFPDYRSSSRFNRRRRRT